MVPALTLLGFDAITDILTILVGAGIGVAGSLINPFVITTSLNTINVNAESSYGLVDGITWRATMYIVMLVIACTLVTLYARNVRKHPDNSAAYMTKKQAQEKWNFKFNSALVLDSKMKATLIIFTLSFILMIVGFVAWEKIIPNFVGFTEIVEKMRFYFPF